MNYDRADLLERLAAEYVIGTLPRLPRQRFERLRRALPAADVAANAWERRLGLLQDGVPPVTPPPAVWQAIARRTGLAARRDGLRWGRWLAPWLGVAVGVLVTVAVVRLAPALLLPVEATPPVAGDTLPASYVGLLLDDAGRPAMLASSTRHGRTLSLKLLRALDVPAGQVAVLWALPAQRAPFALGPMPGSGKGTITMPDASERLLSDVPRLVVTFENALPAAGAAPGVPVLSGHCVKLW